MNRAYRTEDLPALKRIWKEVGWVDSDDEANSIEPFVADAVARVGEVDGTVECAVSTHRGAMRYDGSDLDLLVVSAVATSWVGRKRGMARQLTAECVAQGASEGAEVALLGMFEQGFYERLGFGSGPYEHNVRFDPASLSVTTPYRTPVRLGSEDRHDIAAALQGRRRNHGGITIDSTEYFWAELGWTPNPFGLGYRDEAGRLTHFVWGRATGESGPYVLTWVCYETPEQLMELLGLLRSMGDQVRMISMAEPPDLQLQDLLTHPFRARIITKGTDFESGIRSGAWWQTRILDLPACVARRAWHGHPVRFNLTLSDPIEGMVEAGWQGIGGTYSVELGTTSSAAPGGEAGLETIRAGVGAFSRLWIGAQSASSLALTDELDGPPELISRLDDAFRLPTPRPGIYF